MQITTVRMMHRMRPAAELTEMISSRTSVIVINSVRSDHENQTDESSTDKRKTATV